MENERENEIKLSASSKSNLISCPREYFLRNFQGVFGSVNMRYGSAWHGYMQGYYSHIKENGWSYDGNSILEAGEKGKEIWEEETSKQIYNEDTYLSQAELGRSFLEFINEFSSDEEVLHVREAERSFEIFFPLTKSEKKRYSNIKGDGIIYKGIIDLEVELGELNWVVEFKTTGWSLVALQDSLRRSPQILGYDVCGEILCEDEISGCLVNIHRILSKKKKDGEWGKVSREFRRIPQIYSEGDKKAWRESLLYAGDLLSYHEKLSLWPMQWENCGMYGGCGLREVCNSLYEVEELTEENLTRCDLIRRIPPEKKEISYGEYKI